MIKKIPPEIQKLLDSITNKRAKIVIDHITKHGFITTEDLEQTYGYSHPPRAARDVRECGIPLETFKVKSTSGKSIAAYKFGDLSQINKGKLSGRTVYPKEFRLQLFEESNGKCFICNSTYDLNHMQLDHRIPYEVAGDINHLTSEPKLFMLLCGSCNRSKSWSCEHCDNFISKKKIKTCSDCYWSNPKEYHHIAERNMKRIELIFEKHDFSVYEALIKNASDSNISINQAVIELLKNKKNGG